MNEGKASKPTEKLSKKSEFFCCFVSVQYYLDVLFLKIVGYRRGSGTAIPHSLCSPFSSTLVPTEVFFAILVTVDCVLASLPMPLL